MKPYQVMQLEIPPGIGVKVKDNDVDRCFFRVDLSNDAYKEIITGRFYLNIEPVRKILIHEMQFGELIFCMCCCFKCATPENRKISEEFTAKTGEMISHTYWPEHLADMEKDL